jgi:hypothetical protein
MKECAMNRASLAGILDYEVYLLMTMKLTIFNEEAKLETKLSEFGLSFSDAERVYERVAETLGDEASHFENMKKLLGIDRDAPSVKYSSVLWPEFDFNAIAGKDGLLESAGYRHTRRDAPGVDSPIGLPAWSMDVTEFTERFGPMTGGRKWPLFDEILPAHEQYEFPWEGERYGAAFSWGLFLWVTKLWPEN